MISSLRDFSALMLLTAVAVVHADDPAVHRADHADPQVTVLLEQLGSARYIKREQASASLVELGMQAAPALEQAVQSEDREVRRRARHALREIALRDRPRKLAILRHEGNIPAGELKALHLPGWAILQRYAEDGTSSRRLLAEALETNWDFLDAVTGKTPEIDTIVSDRCLALLRNRSQTRRVASRGDIVAVMLSGLAGMSSLGDQTLNNVFTVINHARPSVSGNRDTLEDRAFRELAGALVARSGDSSAAFQGLNLSMALDLDAGLLTATRVLERGEPRAHVKVFALMAIARFGNLADHTHLVERYLNDDQVYHTSPVPRQSDKSEPSQPPQPRYAVQVRDVALAVTWHLRDESLQRRGFARVQRHPHYVYNPSTLGFLTPEHRQKALDALHAPTE